jgi:hypothetical protein
MKKQLLPFPPPRDVESDQPSTIFSLGDQRFAIQFSVTEVKRQPAQVVPIQKRRSGKPAKAQP